MTEHYVLTRSAYGPDWDIDANRRRLAVTEAVTVPLMAQQTTRDWTWIVLLDPRDQLLGQRIEAFRAGAPRLCVLMWEDRPPLAQAPWDSRSTSKVQAIAATAYRAPWRASMGIGPLLQTRLDDDDGLSPDALARYQSAVHGLERRTVLMLPKGVRVWRGRYSHVIHKRNAMHTLYTPADDATCVYDYGHTKCHQAQPVVEVDQRWGWLWVRHRDTISDWKKADRAISREVRAAFPIDWRALGEAWR